MSTRHKNKGLTLVDRIVPLGWVLNFRYLELMELGEQEIERCLNPYNVAWRFAKDEPAVLQKRIMRQIGSIIIAVMVLVFSSTHIFAQRVFGSTPDRQELEVYHAGLAQVDITPDYPVTLRGFAGRKGEATEVLQPLRAKALAIRGGDEGPAVLIAVDNCILHEAVVGEVAKRLRTKADLPRERLTFTVTHTHTAPVLKDASATLYDLPRPPEVEAHVERYTKELLDKLESVALSALAELRPVRLTWNCGTVTLARNRRTAGGPVDHDMPMLAIHDLGGKLRAVYLSYACHCVTLNCNRISGDWAGSAQIQIERDHPGALAIVSIGCGADSNPIQCFQGGKIEVADEQGRQVADEVKRLLQQQGKFLTGRLNVQYDVIKLPLAKPPSRQQWEKLATQQDQRGFHARVQLTRIQNGQPLDTTVSYPIQSWVFGNKLAIVFLSGEVVVDYSLRLKRELDRERVWINAYSNALRTNCYIPSKRVLEEGGYEGGDAMVTIHDWPARFRPGLEQLIIDQVHQQLGRFFQPR